MTDRLLKDTIQSESLQYSPVKKVRLSKLDLQLGNGIVNAEENEMNDSQSANAEPKATYQDVLDAPPHKIAEIINGKLYTYSVPPPIPCLAYTGLLTHIHLSFHKKRHDGWWIFNRPEIHLGEDVLVPDITGWRRTDMPRIPKTDYFESAPKWLCEVLSPYTREIVLVHKKPVYARNAVSHLWIVDTDARSLEAFELRDAEWALIDRLHDDATVALPPFEELSFRLDDLWVDGAWNS